MMIVWDEPKRLTNLAKLGLDFGDLDEPFFLSSLVVPAKDNRTWRSVGLRTARLRSSSLS